MYHSDLISGFAFVCFNGEAYLFSIYFYHHRNILHLLSISVRGLRRDTQNIFSFEAGVKLS